MIKILKKILGSKIFQISFSAILIYVAFRKVNIVGLLAEYKQVSWWMIVLLLLYMAFSMFFGGLRWAVLVLDKIRLSDVIAFTRATYSGSFYSLFFPSAFAGDLLKWTSLLKKYPDISKVKLAGTAIIDRVIGFSAFCLMALIALIVGKFSGYNFDSWLWILFGALSFGMLVFYLLVFALDLEKIFGKYQIFKKIFEIIDLFKKSNKKRIWICFVISAMAEPVWLLMTWFSSLIFGVGISLMQVFIYMPIISLILVLPISWAGFGARENLFLLFFGQLGFPTEKLLLVSTFNGVIGILSALLGGLVLLF